MATTLSPAEQSYNQTTLELREAASEKDYERILSDILNQITEVSALPQPQSSDLTKESPADQISFPLQSLKQCFSDYFHYSQTHQHNSHRFTVNFSETIKSINDLSIHHINAEHYDVALLILSDCLLLVQQYSFPELQALILNTMSCYFRKKQDNERALSLLVKAETLNYKHSLTNTSLAITLLNKAAVLSQMNRHSEAMKCARAAVGELKANFERYQQKHHHLQNSVVASNTAKDDDPKDEELQEITAQLAIAYHNLATEERHLKQQQKSTKNFELAYQIVVQNLGKQHPLALQFKPAAQGNSSHSQNATTAGKNTNSNSNSKSQEWSSQKKKPEINEAMIMSQNKAKTQQSDKKQVSHNNISINNRITPSNELKTVYSPRSSSNASNFPKVQLSEQRPTTTIGPNSNQTAISNPNNNNNNRSIGQNVTSSSQNQAQLRRSMESELLDYKQKMKILFGFKEAESNSSNNNNNNSGVQNQSQPQRESAKSMRVKQYSKMYLQPVSFNQESSSAAVANKSNQKDNRTMREQQHQNNNNIQQQSIIVENSNIHSNNNLFSQQQLFDNHPNSKQSIEYSSHNPRRSELSEMNNSSEIETSPRAQQQKLRDIEIGQLIAVRRNQSATVAAVNSVPRNKNELIRNGIPKMNYSNESFQNMGVKDSNKSMANTYSQIPISSNFITSINNNPKKHKSHSNLQTRPISAQELLMTHTLKSSFHSSSSNNGRTPKAHPRLLMVPEHFELAAKNLNRSEVKSAKVSGASRQRSFVIKQNQQKVSKPNVNSSSEEIRKNNNQSDNEVKNEGENSQRGQMKQTLGKELNAKGSSGEREDLQKETINNDSSIQYDPQQHGESLETGIQEQKEKENQKQTETQLDQDKKDNLVQNEGSQVKDNQNIKKHQEGEEEEGSKDSNKGNNSSSQQGQTILEKKSDLKNDNPAPEIEEEAIEDVSQEQFVAHLEKMKQKVLAENQQSKNNNNRAQSVNNNISKPITNNKVEQLQSEQIERKPSNQPPNAPKNSSIIANQDQQTLEQLSLSLGEHTVASAFSRCVVKNTQNGGFSKGKMAAVFSNITYKMTIHYAPDTDSNDSRSKDTNNKSISQNFSVIAVDLSPLKQLFSRPQNQPELDQSNPSTAFPDTIFGGPQQSAVANTPSESIQAIIKDNLEVIFKRLKAQQFQVDQSKRILSIQGSQQVLSVLIKTPLQPSGVNSRIVIASKSKQTSSGNNNNNNISHFVVECPISEQMLLKENQKLSEISGALVILEYYKLASVSQKPGIMCVLLSSASQQLQFNFKAFDNSVDTTHCVSIEPLVHDYGTLTTSADTQTAVNLLCASLQPLWILQKNTLTYEENDWSLKNEVEIPQEGVKQLSYSLVQQPSKQLSLIRRTEQWLEVYSVEEEMYYLGGKGELDKIEERHESEDESRYEKRRMKADHQGQQHQQHKNNNNNNSNLNNFASNGSSLYYQNDSSSHQHHYLHQDDHSASASVQEKQQNYQGDQGFQHDQGGQHMSSQENQQDILDKSKLKEESSTVGELHPQLDHPQKQSNQKEVEVNQQKTSSMLDEKAVGCQDNTQHPNQHDSATKPANQDDSKKDGMQKNTNNYMNRSQNEEVIVEDIVEKEDQTKQSSHLANNQQGLEAKQIAQTQLQNQEQKPKEQQQKQQIPNKEINSQKKGNLNDQSGVQTKRKWKNQVNEHLNISQEKEGDVEYLDLHEDIEK